MKASKEARVHKAWREQVARLVAEAMRWPRQEMASRAAAHLGGMPFNVALARSYADRLIAEGERLERERLVFTDWTRERGLGPENREPGAFTLGDAELAMGIARGRWNNQGLTVADIQRRRFGGWPGPLAREWGTVRCTWCVADCPVSRRDCTVCKGRGYVEHPKREAAAANGGARLIRIGRRLLDTLDGRCPWAPSAVAQASECERCADGICQPGGDFVFGVEPGQSVTVGGPAYMGDGGRLRSSGGRVVGLVIQDFGGRAAVRLSTPVPLSRICGDERPPPNPDCEDCRGTGHNLSGTLPPVEHSAHLRCKHNDSHDGAAGDDVRARHRSWVDGVEVGLMDFPRTRVLSRGEHRDPCMITSARAGRESTLDERITDRGWDAEVQQPKGLPRWRRGELRHSEQRRERERRRAGAEFDRFRETNARLRDLLQPAPAES